MSAFRRKSIDNSDKATESSFQLALQKLKAWRQKDNNQGIMDQILPGLFVGGLRATTDDSLMKQNKIQAVVSVLSSKVNSRFITPNRHLHIPLDDLPNSPLDRYFAEAIHFIHEHRMENRNVLVHCLMGLSRSVTIIIAYLTTVTDMHLNSAHTFVKARRYFANPNYGFRRQLELYYKLGRDDQRKELEGKFGQSFHELHAKDSVSIKSD